MDKIISLHIPKTGGTSFQKILEYNYGKIDIVGSAPLFERCQNNKPTLKMKSFPGNIIHGHILFDEIKYDKNNFYLAWVRDPVERVISHYFYWKQKPNNTKIHPIEQEIKDGLPLEEFAKRKCMRDIQTYFIGTGIEKMNFIGITEYFNESLEILRMHIDINVKFDCKKERENKNKDYVSKEIRQIIATYNQNDIRLYDFAKQKLGLAK